MAEHSFTLKGVFSVLCAVSIAGSVSAGHGGEHLHHQHLHHRVQARDVAVERRGFDGFQMYDTDFLDNMITKLSSGCRTALTQTIVCDDHVETLARLDFHGALDNDTLTDSVCDQDCLVSLQDWFDNTETACGGFTMDDGTPPTLLPGRMLQGRAEICLQDSTTGLYCNEVILDFTAVSSISEMPTAEICSECYVARLAIMQESPYSAYDEFFKARLEYIYDRCSLTGDTSIPPNPIPLPEHNVPCITGNTYTTVAGDTCDSLALANSFASAALFMGNSAKIINCADLPAGLDLCLPVGCDTTYTVQAGDTCFSIEISEGLARGAIQKYNSWVNSTCQNLVAASDEAYGHVICLTPQGGVSDGDAPDYELNPLPIASEYGLEWLDVPAGATVAANTTLQCSGWYTAQEGDLCANIAVKGPTTIDILMEVNPALGVSVEDCDGNIVVGLTYCALPRIGWHWDLDEPDDPITWFTMPGGTETATEPPSSTTDTGGGIVTPTPTQPGMTSDCDDFYLVEVGDGCADIASAHGISLSDFYAWNTGAGSNCESLWAEVYVCVGILGDGDGDPTPTSSTPPGNGIPTPTPVQGGMTSDCDEFHLVVTGDGCWDIATTAGISLADFYAWNPAVGTDCAGLWLDYYVCISLI